MFLSKVIWKIPKYTTVRLLNRRQLTWLTRHSRQWTSCETTLYENKNGAGTVLWLAEECRHWNMYCKDGKRDCTVSLAQVYRSISLSIFNLTWVGEIMMMVYGVRSKTSPVDFEVLERKHWSLGGCSACLLVIGSLVWFDDCRRT